ncbi:MAG TPA: ribonuclease HII [Caulobacteraceae bacterium]|nr:ribonuclease HII [Caulobacteraceae bacterium]
MNRIGPDLKLERACPAPVCGVDEAGRGPWAGPVAAAAVILRTGSRTLAGLDDSKKLTVLQRRKLEARIKSRAVAWGVGFASVQEIASFNILQATGLAMRRAIEALTVAPAFALVDGAYAFALPCPVKTVVGGDGRCASIAAASILAKTARDRLMARLDAEYPGYGFAAHKGYRAPIHARALLERGPCAIHRMNWAPVKLALMGKDPMLAWEEAAEAELPFA